MGNFRPETFTAAITGAFKVPGFLSQEARRTSEFIDQSLSDLVSAFGRQWKKALDGAIDFDIKAVTRLAKISHTDLEGMRFMRLGDVTEEYMILHANVSALRRLSKAASQKKLRTSKLNPSDFTILDDADNIIAAENPRFLAQFKGVDVEGCLDWTDVKNLKNKHLKIQRLTQLDAKVTVIPKTSKLARKLSDMDVDLGATIEMQAETLRVLRKALPPVVILFEIWNLQSMVHALNYGEEGILRRRTDLVSAVSDLSYATLQGIVDILGEGHKVAQTIRNFKIPLGEIRLPGLPALGAVAAFGSAALSLMDLVDNFEENDADAAIGHGIAAAGFTIFGLALLGGTEVLAGAQFLWLFQLGALAPYTWVALGIVLIGVVIASALNDEPIEEWAANGPFCKGDGSDDFAYLRNDEELSYAALASCLFSPRIKIRRLGNPVRNDTKKGDLVVKVHLPNFNTGKDVLDVRACIQKPKPNTGRAVVMAPQQSLTPYSVKQITGDGGHLTAIEYYYRDTSGHQSFSHWYAKARIITPEGLILPEPKRRQGTGEIIDPKGRIPEKPVQKKGESNEDFKRRQETYQAELNTIDKDIPGWVYADLSYREK